MKKLEPREEAKQIVDDYYNLMNQTYGGKGYNTAKKYAIDMMDERLSTPDLHPDELEHWFEIKQAMIGL